MQRAVLCRNFLSIEEDLTVFGVLASLKMRINCVLFIFPEIGSQYRLKSKNKEGRGRSN